MRKCRQACRWAGGQVSGRVGGLQAGRQIYFCIIYNSRKTAYMYINKVDMV